MIVAEFKRKTWKAEKDLPSEGALQPSRSVLHCIYVKTVKRTSTKAASFLRDGHLQIKVNSCHQFWDTLTSIKSPCKGHLCSWPTCHIILALDTNKRNLNQIFKIRIQNMKSELRNLFVLSFLWVQFSENIKYPFSLPLNNRPLAEVPCNQDEKRPRPVADCMAPVELPPCRLSDSSYMGLGISYM